MEEEKDNTKKGLILWLWPPHFSTCSLRYKNEGREKRKKGKKEKGKQLKFLALILFLDFMLFSLSYFKRTERKWLLEG